ncbi:hypothetical protein MPSEU_000608700 [Mayamaea pseudoterrestris]|nr:hypothetical protein MPSEU_000608700 [Mayamaea pseudoterrestris]
MYCGDETGSFIGDVGSHTSRFGYGGNDSPVYHVPSYTSTFGNDKPVVVPSCLSNQWAQRTVQTPLRQPRMSSDDDAYSQPIVDPTSYLQQSDSAENYNSLEHIWRKAMVDMRVFDNLKHTKGSDTSRKETVAASGVKSSSIQAQALADGKCVHPILAVSPGCTFKVGSSNIAADSRKELIKLAELMMETFDAKAFFCAPTPMLAAFSHGRPTALVVDIGAGGTRVTPVIDGLVMKQAQRRSGRGGDWLSNVQWKAIMSQVDEEIRPHYQVSFKSTLKSKGIYHRWAMQEIMYEFQTSGYVHLANWWHDSTVPFVYADDAMDVDPASPASASTESSYVLPDGQVIDLTNRVGKDLCRIPELYFSDELPYLPDNKIVDQSILGQHFTLSNLSLPRLIHSSLSAVGDVDARKDLAGSILLTGGSSQFENLEQRLSLEVPRYVSSAFKCKVVASKHSIERSCASWIGGSILTSLGSFQQLWMSRAEYEEYGAALAVQRFP